MKTTTLLPAFAALLLPFAASASKLKPVHPELAAVLGLAESLAATPVEVGGPPLFVRVFSVPTAVAECGGTVTSCPDVRLLITVSNGDLGEMPLLFELPHEKGWEFKQWLTPSKEYTEPTVGLLVRTSIPGSNISAAERKLWRPAEYEVWLHENGASYERHEAQQGVPADRTRPSGSSGR